MALGRALENTGTHSRCEGEAVRRDCRSGVRYNIIRSKTASRPSGAKSNLTKPEEGIPFDTEDAMFNPAPSSRLSHKPPWLQSNQAPVNAAIANRGTETGNGGENETGTETDRDRDRERDRTEGPRRRKSPTRNHIIPLEEDIRRLMQECKIGIGNANLLGETLKSCAPEDVAGNEIIEAEKSRQARDADHEAKSMADPSYKWPKGDADETTEEKLLARLLHSNAEFVGAVNKYDDLVRIAQERRAEEISRQETRMNPRERDLALAQEAYATNGARGELYSDGRLGASRPSIDRSRSPTPSVLSYESRDKASTFSHQMLPQGPRDPHNRQSPPHQHRKAYQQHQDYEASNLAPPRHVPHGPRSPGQFSVQTRSPSPGHGSLLDQQQHAMYQMQQQQQQQAQPRSEQAGYHTGVTTPRYHRSKRM